jgi:surface antigen
MVLGKLLILLVTNSAYAADLDNPRFFSYQGRSLIGQTINLSFGWFKTLDSEQKAAYYQSITHAVMYAENGQRVEWYQNDASGFAMPVTTWPTGSGYCRRIYIQAIAYNTEKNMQKTACYDNPSTEWRWLGE